MLQLTSALGVGSAAFGSSIDGPLWWGPQDDGAAVDAVRAALDHGVAWVDTAPMYGWGAAERLVGRALVGRRDGVVLLTKGGSEPPDRPSAAPGLRSRIDCSPTALRAGLEASLRRLGVDHVDALQVHDVDDRVPIEDSWGAVMELVEEGKVRVGGLSNHPVDLMDRACAVGPVGVVQHQYSVLHREPERDGVLEWCRANDVPFLAWAPLASGFLADGFDLNALAPDDLRRGLPWAADARAISVVSDLDLIARATGCTRRELALAWVVHRAGHAIVGARNAAEGALLGGPRTVDPDALTAVTELL